jgi:hypothetical protein
MLLIPQLHFGHRIMSMKKDIDNLGLGRPDKETCTLIGEERKSLSFMSF